MKLEFGDEAGIPLRGGNVADVVRVGDTVRRSSGPWTPAVHALLQFLEDNDYPHSPRVLGMDSAGREVLTYIDGTVGFYPLPSYMWSEPTLGQIARALRQLHDVTVGFTPPQGATWRDQAGTLGDPEVICHTDWSPYNAVFEQGQFIAMIDWDFANPGSRLWDLAWVAFAWTPLMDDEDAAALGWSQAPERGRRLRLLVDSYGLDASSREQLLPAVRQRLSATADWIERRAQHGDPPFQRMASEGHAHGYRRHERFVARHLPELQAALRS